MGVNEKLTAIFTNDLIGKKIAGCINDDISSTLLVEDGTAIKIFKDLINDDSLFVEILSWKPTCHGSYINEESS